MLKFCFKAICEGRQNANPKGGPFWFLRKKVKNLEILFSIFFIFSSYLNAADYEK